MYNYRKGKIKYKANELGSLYIDESKLSDTEEPIIYIGGQMEHRGHVIEQSGYTGDLCHGLYTGSWMYDYPVTGNNKSKYNAKNFSENLLEDLKLSQLKDVTLVTCSHGGLIAAHASKSDLIKRIIAIHSPILGTPLANLDLAKCRILLNKYQYLLTRVISLVVDYNYGFQKDNYHGLMNPFQMDASKILAVNSVIDEETEKNKLLLETYKIIMELTGHKSDGVVVHDAELYASLGIECLETDDHVNHFEATNSEYVEEIVKRVLKK